MASINGTNKVNKNPETWCLPRQGDHQREKRAGKTVQERRTWIGGVDSKEQLKVLGMGVGGGMGRPAEVIG